MAKHSAGILPFRIPGSGPVEVLLVHPGGPFWAAKDEGAWSLPKGEYDPATEEAPVAAEREFAEELGVAPPEGRRLELGEVRQPGGKRVVAWALRCDVDATAVVSNTFEMEWPPRSGTTATFPEVDRAEWFPLPRARTKLLKGQVPFLDRLTEALERPGVEPPAP
jgi:predicted NUDIX family NTP pyrophosphohydrolase